MITAPSCHSAQGERQLHRSATAMMIDEILERQRYVEAVHRAALDASSAISSDTSRDQPWAVLKATMRRRVGILSVD